MCAAVCLTVACLGANWIIFNVTCGEPDLHDERLAFNVVIKQVEGCRGLINGLLFTHEILPSEQIFADGKADGDEFCAAEIGPPEHVTYFDAKLCLSLSLSTTPIFIAPSAIWAAAHEML
jgi:hypothetical protein